MKTTKSLDEIVQHGVDAYLKKNAELIENVGESLVGVGEISIMINCYFDDNGAPIPLYEFEDDGRIEQYDNLQDAFEAFFQVLLND